MSSALTRIVGREYRQEFANHHLGAFRKALKACHDISDYWGRHRYAWNLSDDHDGLPELPELLVNGVVRLAWDEDAIAPFLQLCRERRDATQLDDNLTQEGKSYYLNLLTELDYEPGSPYMQLALDEKLLHAVASYLGQAAFIQSIELILSCPAAEPHILSKSQLWHCDNHNDRRLLKLFLYVTDVSDKNGPLTFMPKQLSCKIPWYAGHYVSDATLSRYISLDDRVEFTGPAGSMLLMDTASLYHFGSRCIKPRLTFVVHYNSGFGFLPRSRFHDRWNEGRDSLSEIQRFALGYL